MDIEEKIQKCLEELISIQEDITFVNKMTKLYGKYSISFIPIDKRRGAIRKRIVGLKKDLTEVKNMIGD